MKTSAPGSPPVDDSISPGQPGGPLPTVPAGQDQPGVDAVLPAPASNETLDQPGLGVTTM